MIRRELILNPAGRLTKVFIVPLAIATSVFIGIYFFGYRGRLKSPIPVTVLNRLSPFEITLVILLLLLSIYVIFFLRIDDVQNLKTITIDDKAITIFDSNNKRCFQLKKAKGIFVSVSKMWATVYSHRFYRIGIIRFAYGNDKFVFYFPIRNQDIERKVKDLSKALR
jgi:hypothetical protein